MELIQNLINNYKYLQQDYIGIHLSISVVFNLITNITISLGLIISFYLLGTKLKNIFLARKNFQDQEIFIKIALGYVFIGTGLAVLGFFSFLNPLTITIYITLIVLIAIFPLKSLRENFKDLNKFRKQLLKDFKIHRWIFIWVILFILIGFIKLQSPEMREDQYHTDLPVQYLKNQTIMLPSKELILVSASPQLGEMSYLISIFLGSKEASRYIHLIFYILIILLLYSLSKDRSYNYVILAPLLFITAPEVIHETSSQYTDFQWIFLFLLSTIILMKSKGKNTNIRLVLSGFIFGGMIATKLWTIAFIIVPIVYIFISFYNSNKSVMKYIFIFIIFSMIVPSIWFLRSLILTGSPTYPAFANRETLDGIVGYKLFDYFTLNYHLYNPLLLKIFSPLFFLGLFIFMIKFRDNLILLKRNNLLIYFILLFILYNFIPYQYGRYQLGLYSIFIIIVSGSLFKKINNIFYKLFATVILSLMFLYYFINSLLILPYGLGLADKNKYLTRILSRDNSSYYDFDHKFNKFISKSDLVATYGIYGYYYANFNYIDVGYIFEKKNMSFGTLRENKITKLFIKNEDVSSFCNKLKLTGCTSEKYILMSYFSAIPYSGASYYLYEIK